MALQFVTVRQGLKFGPEYTEALRAQVPGLVCLGDDRPFGTNLTGWHAKLELFAPWNADLRPMLFFDLDTFVVGDLEPFEQLDASKLWLIDCFSDTKLGETGIMLIPDSQLSDDIWPHWVNIDPAKGDAELIRQFPHQRLNKSISGIYSYKHHCRDGIPDDARIICFHGKPRPKEAPGWAQDYWKTQISQTKIFLAR